MVGWYRSEVHKIPARVQCTVQACELSVSNLHTPPYRSRQIICLSHSESVRLPLQLPMRPSPHQLQAGQGRSIPCTRARHSSTHHRILCAVHGLCTSDIDVWWNWIHLEGNGRGLTSGTVQSRNFLGGTEENHGKHQSGKPVSSPRFQPSTSWIRV
jgi:hypothetical protein